MGSKMTSWLIILSILGFTLAIPTVEVQEVVPEKLEKLEIPKLIEPIKVEDEILNTPGTDKVTEDKTLTKEMIKHDPSKLTKLDGRVVGGVEVRIEDLPYQVSLQYVWRHICGGALIGSKYILTAAHCTDGVHDHNLFKVRAGSSLHNSGGIMRSVKRVYQHPLYNSINIDNDVSVLELNNPIFNSKIARVIPMIEAGGLLKNGAMCIVSGWGYLSENGLGPQKLHAVEVPVVDRDRCNVAYDGAITERMFCAGYLDVGGKDACQGDSGGPIVSDGKLVGVVSWGYGCARPKFPGVYSNIGALREFIDKVYH